MYDCLNVLEALGVVRKEKREVVWAGWPQVGRPAQAEAAGARRGLATERICRERVQLRYWEG